MTREELNNSKARGVVSVLDYPYWSTVAPTTQGQLTFFGTGGAITSSNGIDTALQLDKTALFVMEMLQLTVNTDDGAPVAAADLTAIGRAIRSAWINFTKNGGQRVGRWPVSAFLAMPQAIITSGGYDLTPSVRGVVKLNTPADIPGGESLEVTLNWPATIDLTGIEISLKLYGLTYRTLAN